MYVCPPYTTYIAPSRELRLNTIRDLVAHVNLRRALALPTANAMLVYVGDPLEKGYKKDRHTGDETIKNLYYGLKNGF